MPPKLHIKINIKTLGLSENIWALLLDEEAEAAYLKHEIGTVFKVVLDNDPLHTFNDNLQYGSEVQCKIYEEGKLPRLDLVWLHQQTKIPSIDLVAMTPDVSKILKGIQHARKNNH